MNRWNCDYAGCGSSCVGEGGAIGLRAIGWYFVPGTAGRLGNTFCPAHRPDAVLSTNAECTNENACSQCTAEKEASELQLLISERLGINVDWARKCAAKWNKPAQEPRG